MLFAVFLFYFNFINLFFAYLIAILLHELGHAIVAKKLGYELNAIKLMPYGTQLSIKSKIENQNHDLIISLAGPLVNLFLIIINLSLWWLFPSIYIYTETFVIANIISFLFNLLPVFPLDGGRVILNLLSRKLEREKSYKIIQNFGAILAILFFIFFLISLFYKLNATFFIISFFLMESALSKNENVFYQTIYLLETQKKPLKHKKNIQSLAVPENISLLKALHYIKAHYFTIFYVLNNEQKVKKILTEKQLKNYLLNYPANSLLKDIL